MHSAKEVLTGIFLLVCVLVKAFMLVEWFKVQPMLGQKYTRILCFSVVTLCVCEVKHFLSTGFEFPIDFIPIVRRIFRTYFAILAHIYHHHFHDIRALDLHDGLNSLFLHFVYFVQEFSLVEAKEMQCVEELIHKLIQLDQDMAKHPSADEFVDTIKAKKLSSE